MYRFGFLLFMALATTNAAEVAIYSGSALVASQEETDRGQGLRQALQQTLIKASGDASLANHPELPRQLLKASSLVRHSAYQRVIESSEQSEAENVWMLEVDFDRAGVAAILRELGRALWPAERPTALIWLVIDNNGQKQIASAFQVSALSALTATASARGLPIQLPRLDGADLGRVDPVTLWDATPNTVIGASQRYNAKLILVARLQKQAGRWTGHYTLIDGLEVEHWEAKDSSADKLLSTLINGSTDRIARRYASTSNEPPLGMVDVWITDIDSVSDYVKAMGYLSKLAEVRETSLLRADGSSLLIKLDITVGVKRFRQLLEIDRVLKLEPTPAASAKFTLQLAH